MSITAVNTSCLDSPPVDSIQVPLLDVSRVDEGLKQRIAAAIGRVCDSGRFVLGEDVDALEQSIAGYVQCGHAIGCASGSDALLLALMAAGIGPGDEVILPSYTFFATASSVWRMGARPVFADIDPRTFNLDPDAVAECVTPRTRAVLPVHLYGQCAEMEPLESIARVHSLRVIEDAAQAIGAEYHGRRAGSMGDVGCFSFYPTKNLGALGDGGMVTTGDDRLADRLRMLRVHGMRERYHHEAVGINSRLDSIQAAVLREKLAWLDEWTAMRRQNARCYGELFTGRGLADVVALPHEASGRRHVWNQYVIRVAGGRRDALRAHLTRSGIGTEIYYPVPLHLQPCFSSLGYAEGSLPETERAARETLALPIFPGLTPREQQAVVQRVAEFFEIVG